MGDDGTCGCGGGSDCGCGGNATGGSAEHSPFVYAIGQIEPRPASLGVEKEFADALGRIGEEGEVSNLGSLLADRDNRYLVRNLNWVLQIDGVDTYSLSPRDPADFDLLLEAVRPDGAGGGINAVIGLHAPPGIATPLPGVVFEQLYSFDREALVQSLDGDIAPEVVDTVMRLTHNTGTAAGSRALNYLIIRYARVYELANDLHAAGRFLTSVETFAIDGGARDLVDVVFTFTDRATSVSERFAARVDVTEPFPFLKSGFAPHVAMALHQTVAGFPGFTAPAALAPTGIGGGPVAFASFGVDFGPGFGMWCFYQCLEGKLRGGGISMNDLDKAAIQCAALCGIPYTPTIIAELMAWARSIGLLAPAGTAAAAETGAGATAAGGTVAGVGTAGAAAGTGIVVGVGWLLWKLWVANGSWSNPPPHSAPGAPAPAGTPNPCAGFLNPPPPPMKGWGADAAHLTKSGCQVAIDEAIDKANAYCATLNSQCSARNCTTGKSCVSLAVVDEATNQTHLFWCGARVRYRCACFCV